MEICINDYIRTKNGIIAKVTYVDGLMLDTDMEVFDIGNTMMMEIPTEFVEEYVVKHSKNIIDLVEEDDIVILEYYVQKYRQRITRKFEVGIIYGKIYFDNRHCSFWYDLENKKWGNGKGFNPKIKSILTKEQYEKNSYKL